MNTFQHFPPSKKCPICGTVENLECILIPIAGTQNGNLMQAIPTHVHCLAEFAVYHPGNDMIVVECERLEDLK